MNKFAVTITASVYQHLLKPALFQLDPESVHDSITSLAEKSGQLSVLRKTLNNFYNLHDEKLSQKIAGINFLSPIGLAAGYDYEAKLTQISPVLGFGFQTIGTITNYPYSGNAKPRLGRLLKS